MNGNFPPVFLLCHVRVLFHHCCEMHVLPVSAGTVSFVYDSDNIEH